MKRYRYLLPAILFYLSIASTGLCHGTGKAHKHEGDKKAIKAADAWLIQADNLDHQSTWHAAAVVFQSSITAEQWQKALTSVRKPLGGLNHRYLYHERYTTTLEGMPDGDYLVLRFMTRFENKANAVETVILKMNEQHTWKVAGYFIK